MSTIKTISLYGQALLQYLAAQRSHRLTQKMMRYYPWLTRR